MRVVLIGGHLSPALSVIDAMPKDIEILFVGRKYALEGDKTFSLEYKTINSRNIDFAEITAARLQRRLTRHTINSLLKFPVGLVQSFFILRKFKPDVVVGFGGYVSLPVSICAFLIRIPVIVHEQTLGAGFSNKIISIFAKKVCISWNSSREFFPKHKTVLTGNPIREFTIYNLQFTIDKRLPTIYVTGGSSGSHFINTLIEGCIEDLLKKFNVVHQTGDAKEFGDFDRLTKLRESLTPLLRTRYTVRKFFDPSEIGSILNSSDLVVSRAGINTITELIYFEKPAILIPLSFSQASEQLKNARLLEVHRLGKVMLQNEVDSHKLYQGVMSMFGNIEKYKLDKSEWRSLQRNDAVENIIKVIKYVGSDKKDS